MDRPAGFREIFDRKRTGYAQKQVKAYAKQNRLCRASIRDRLRQTAGQYRRALEMAAAAAGGAVFAGAHILGGIAPFGVALAARGAGGTVPAGAVRGAVRIPLVPGAGKCQGYAAAILLLGGVRWTLSSGSPVETHSPGARCAWQGAHAGGRGGCGLRPGR